MQRLIGHAQRSPGHWLRRYVRLRLVFVLLFVLFYHSARTIIPNHPATEPTSPAGFGTTRIRRGDEIITMPKARQTCTQCSVRRQKCDRSVPCGRCLSRGVAHLCKFAWSSPEASRVHRGTSQQPRRTTSPVSTTHPDIAGSLNQNSVENNESLNIRSPSGERHQQPSDISRVSPELETGLDNEVLRDDSTGDHVLVDLTGRLLPTDDVLAPTLSHRRTSLQTSEDESALPVGFPNIRETSIGLLQLHLPSVTQIWHLADYHEKYLLWYHGCYHGPTFRAELLNALVHHNDNLHLDQLDLQWVALLFSIMAGSISCASVPMLAAWGFCQPETVRLPQQWYDATLTCLHLACYTRNHNIYAAHAITTLTMSAHLLGLSEELTVLLGTALKVAQSLRLNRLDCKTGSEVIDETSSETLRNRILRREIGRRLWSQLCVQDWFSLPSGGSLIRPSDFTTIKPSNRDHVTMAHIDETYPTYISYGNYLNEIAKLMAEHHIAMTHASTPYNRYEKVLMFDKKMRKLAKDIPGYFSVTTPIHPSWPVFIPWARRSLTICFAHKIIMIHRTFIGSSFTNPAFQMTRNTCIAAAKTILKEAKQEQDEGGPVIWIDQVCACR
jgi:hypothetical protein